MYPKGETTSTQQTLLGPVVQQDCQDYDKELRPFVQQLCGVCLIFVSLMKHIGPNSQNVYDHI